MFSTWALSKEYGLTDVDGGRPDWSIFFPRKVQEIVDGDGLVAPRGVANVEQLWEAFAATV